MDVAFVPGGCTSLVQVADVVVNRPFKRCLRELYMTWRARNILEHATKTPSRADVAEWIMQAWDSVALSSIREGMLKYIMDAAREPMDASSTAAEVGSVEDEPDVGAVEEAFENLALIDAGALEELPEKSEEGEDVDLGSGEDHDNKDEDL